MAACHMGNVHCVVLPAEAQVNAAVHAWRSAAQREAGEHAAEEKARGHDLHMLQVMHGLAQGSQVSHGLVRWQYKAASLTVSIWLLVAVLVS